MAELADRIPGEIIFAAYANDIRDRAVMRYIDTAARDASEPLPDTGEMAYLTSTGEFQIYDGTAWVGYARLDGATFSGSVFAPYVQMTSQGNIAWEMLGTLQAYNEPASTRSWFAMPQGQDVFWGPRSGGEQMGRFIIQGDVQIDRTILNADGTAPLPAYAFLADNDTGMYRNSSDVLAFATGGSRTALIRDPNSYAIGVDAGSNTMREILVGTNVPNNSWGKDGDVYIRY